jgi:hypothetical protein
VVPVREIATTRPPAGAGPLIVTDAVLELPPITDVGANEIASKVVRLTVKLAVFDTPLAVAVRVTDVFDDTGLVAAVVTALTAPSGTVIDAGTVTAALLDDNATTNPPAGAGPERVTVTSEADPPITEPGFTVMDSTALRRTVN